MKRIEQKFSELKNKNQCALVGYTCAYDPDYETSFKILKELPKNGVDIIEIGVPFLDPAGDGPIIENAAKRAIKNGATLKKTLQMVEKFRKNDFNTPIVLMSYYNPIFKFGCDTFFTEAYKSGVDGILIVDLPIEENEEILSYIKKSNLDLIQLIAPTTNSQRIREIAKNSSGFLYLISMLGVTGTKTAKIEENKINLEKIHNICSLPVVIGFGIKEAKQAGDFSKIGVDGIVVGSAFVKEIDNCLTQNKSSDQICEITLKKVKEFSKEIKNESN